MLLWLLLLGGSWFTEVKKIDLTKFDYSFTTSSTGVAASPAGQLCIFNESGMKLLFLDKQGEKLAEKGGKGQGPGEFQFFAGVYWSAFEKAFVSVDWGNHTIVKWSPNGKMLGSANIPMPMVGGDCAFSSGGAMFFSDDTLGIFVDPMINFFDYDKNKIVKIFEHKMHNKQVYPKLKSGGIFVADWNPRLCYAVGSDFIAVAFGAENQIRILDLQGRPAGKVINVGMKQQPLTQMQVETALDELAPENAGSLKKQLKVPDFWQPILAMAGDSQNRIWVFGPRATDLKPYPFKVFTRNGLQVGDGDTNLIPSTITDSTMYSLHQIDENYYVVITNFSLTK